MQFRQIVDRAFAEEQVNPEPAMETNAFTAALAQVANGSAATIAPSRLVDSLQLDAQTITLSLTRPAVSPAIGLVVLDHEPSLPAIAALKQTIHGYHDN